EPPPVTSAQSTRLLSSWLTASSLPLSPAVAGSFCDPKRKEQKASARVNASVAFNEALESPGEFSPRNWGRHRPAPPCRGSWRDHEVSRRTRSSQWRRDRRRN